MNKRYALTIGINDYPGTGNDLSGCVNDANDWRSELELRDFDVTMMLDSNATKANILDELRRNVSYLGYRDTLVVCYSGHGSWVPDQDYDEEDLRDEVWVAYDFPNGGLVNDDDLYGVFSKKKFGTKIVVLSDSCFSGTVTRFTSMIVNPASLHTKHLEKVRYLPPGNFLEGNELHRAIRAPAVHASESRTPALLISGCGEDEYSYDAWINGRYNGAFTYYALQQLKSGPRSYKEWHNMIRQVLPAPTTYPQSPELQSNWYQKNVWTVL